jgi:hypothetical protein
VRPTRIIVRPLIAIALVIATASLAACGGDEQAGPAAGTPENPLIGKTTAGGAASTSNEQAPKPADKPGYDTLLDRQSGSSQSRFTPCNLVTRSQAQDILGSRVQAPVEAAQGPTCIYRTEDGKAFITLAVQSLDIDRLKKQVRGRRTVDVSDRTAYCGIHGTSMLYVPLGQSRVLSVAAPCSVAKRFAARAVLRFES